MAVMRPDESDRKGQQDPLAKVVARLAPGNGTGDNRDSRINEPWSDQRLATWVKQYYPGYADGLIIPEIRGLMLAAATKGWDQGKLDVELAKTNWFKNVVNANNKPIGPGPGSGSRGGGGGGGSAGPTVDDINTVKALISDQARTLGIDPTDDQLTWIATYGINKGYSQVQYTDEIVKLAEAVGAGGTRNEGTIVVDKEKLKTLGLQYMIPLSDTTLQDYAIRIAKGEMDETGVESVLRQQAKARSPYLAEMIDQGVRPMDFYAPVRDTIARTLELPADSVNLMDAEWQKMIEVPDERTGLPRAATLTEAAKMARSSKRWASTDSSKDLAASWATGLQKAFGQN